MFKPEEGLFVIKKRTTAGITSQEWLDAIEVKKERDIKNKVAESAQILTIAFIEIGQAVEFLLWKVRWWPFLKRRP